MSTIQDAIRTAEMHAADVKRMLDVGGFCNLISCVEAHSTILQRDFEAVTSTQAGIERTRRFAEICIQYKWPPPWHMPSRVIDQFTAAFDGGKITHDETAEIFASFYTPERIEGFTQRWATYGWLAHRHPILNEALGNHIAGRHFSAVCVLLPQIDGALREALGEKPTRTNSVDVIRGYQLATAAGRFFSEVVLENFDPHATSPIPDLSRHAILHGVATDYGTPAHSLKLILIADIILSSIEEARSWLPEGKPMGEET